LDIPSQIVSFKCKMRFLLSDILTVARARMGLNGLDNMGKLCGFPVPWRLFFICFAILL